MYGEGVQERVYIQGGNINIIYLKAVQEYCIGRYNYQL